MYVDDSWSGAGSHYKFAKADVERFVSRAEELRRRPSSAPARLQSFLEGLNSVGRLLVNTTALVLGSQEPWYEALLLAWGAGQVVTMEYNNLTYVHERVQTVTPRAFLASEAGGEYFGPRTFDVILAVAAVDHDGLGRYGDPLAPDGDLLTMDWLKGQRTLHSPHVSSSAPLHSTLPSPVCVSVLCSSRLQSAISCAPQRLPCIRAVRRSAISLCSACVSSQLCSPVCAQTLVKTPAQRSSEARERRRRSGGEEAAVTAEDAETSGGVLILTAPIGPDLVVWNLERRYGPVRLPLLLEGWDVKQRFGYIEEKLYVDESFRKRFEPVWILAPQPTPPALDAHEDL
jgi:hypothetical protein